MTDPRPLAPPPLLVVSFTASPEVEAFLDSYQGRDIRIAGIRRVFADDGTTLLGYTVAWTAPEDGWYLGRDTAFTRPTLFPALHRAQAYVRAYARLYAHRYL